MSDKIASIQAMEILDSRGNPTIRVFVTLENGINTAASVPSGISTGGNEALELRDGDKKRYSGKGVLKAIDNVSNVIAPQLIGVNAYKQSIIDRIMIDLDGTENKSNLGANAILGVSMAVARAASISHKVPLYQYLGGVGARRIPVPCMNILNGGIHSDNNVDFQEFMAVPIGAPTFSEGLRFISETFHVLKDLLKKNKLETSVGDEGGFAPNVASNEAAIELIIDAIEKAGYIPGKDISIAIDSAANSFSPNLDGNYNLEWSKAGVKSSADLVQLAVEWVKKYPIILWEDPLSEGDWSGFKIFTEKLGNQIGTITESIEAIKMCRDNGWRFFISHRSGETEDDFLADFAVAMDGGHFKTGSASRSERIAKYNRLLEIEKELGDSALYYWS